MVDRANIHTGRDSEASRHRQKHLSIAITRVMCAGVFDFASGGRRVALQLPIIQRQD